MLTPLWLWTQNVEFWWYDNNASNHLECWESHSGRWHSTLGCIKPIFLEILKIWNFWTMFRDYRKSEFWDSGWFWDRIMVLALPDRIFRRFWRPTRNFRIFKKNIKVCLMDTKVECYRRKLRFTASGVSQRSLPTPHDLGILSSNPGFSSHVTAQKLSDRIFRRFWRPTRNFRIFKKKYKSVFNGY